MKLSKKSVQFARNHIRNFYDSDFFVKPFEFNALWDNWGEVEAYLRDKETSSFPVRPPLTFEAPKPKIGYRIVHQLDPLDSMVYTALAYEVAETIERCRTPIKNRIACSYRINVNFDGGIFFTKDNGFDNFKARSYKLATSYSYVLTTDITDFYNHIYLHRLQNSLERCNPKPKEISKEIEQFLLKINNKISRGIPVGPAASVIMAEAYLIDIDEFILSKNTKYVRYVDDFRIFSNSQFKLEQLLRELTRYLYSNHRLNLSSGKTEILGCKDFIKKYLDDPETMEREAIHKALEELKIPVNLDYPSPEPINDIDLLPNGDKFKIQATALQRLMNDIIGRDMLDLGLARHVLRKAKKLGSRAIVHQLLENFDLFAPVIRDVVLYLDEITNRKVIEYTYKHFTRILKESAAIKVPFVRYWMLYYFSKYSDFNKYRPIKDFVINDKDIRSQALFAKTNKVVSWVRAHKDEAYNYGPWEKRAVISSAIVLPSDERNPWMDLVLKSGDLIDKSLAKYVKSY